MGDKEIKEILKNSQKLTNESKIEFYKAIKAMKLAQKKIMSLL